jgi:hypothetical protein
MLVCLLSLPGTVFGQSLKEEIVGAWRIVSIYKEQNGVKHNVYADRPGDSTYSTVSDTSSNISLKRTCPSLQQAIG